MTLTCHEIIFCFKEVKSGCSRGGECTCACKKYVHVHNTNDCYTCGHLPSEHVGLGRVSMSEGTD